MANIQVRRGDFDAAEEFYNKAYTLEPDSDALNVNLATVLIQKQDWEGAFEKLKVAVLKNPKNDKARVGLAMAFNYLGDFALAKGNIEEAIELNPKNRTAVHLYAQWGVRDSELGRPIRALQEYLYQVQKDTEISLLLVHLFVESRQLSAARLELERALLWEPKSELLLKIESELKTRES